METLFLGAVLVGTIVFIARNLRRKFKGESCSNCGTGSSKCTKMGKGDNS
jgi:hypothetical protein